MPDVISRGNSTLIIYEMHFKNRFQDFPFNPPKLKMLSEIWHPNIDKNGNICISFLITPDTNKYKFLEPFELWRPVYAVEMIIMQVIAILIEPSLEGPINVDAAMEFRDQLQLFKRKALKHVTETQEDYNNDCDDMDEDDAAEEDGIENSNQALPIDPTLKDIRKCKNEDDQGRLVLGKEVI